MVLDIQAQENMLPLTSKPLSTLSIVALALINTCRDTRENLESEARAEAHWFFGVHGMSNFSLRKFFNHEKTCQTPIPLCLTCHCDKSNADKSFVYYHAYLRGSTFFDRVSFGSAFSCVGK